MHKTDGNREPLIGIGTTGDADLSYQAELAFYAVITDIDLRKELSTLEMLDERIRNSDGGRTRGTHLLITRHFISPRLEVAADGRLNRLGSAQSIL